MSLLPQTWMIFAATAGLGIALASLFVTSMYAHGAPLAMGMSSIYIIALIIAMIVGYLFLGEKPSLINMAGFAIALLAIPLMLYKK